MRRKKEKVNEARVSQKRSGCLRNSAEFHGDSKEKSPLAPAPKIRERKELDYLFFILASRCTIRKYDPRVWKE